MTKASATEAIREEEEASINYSNSWRQYERKTIGRDVAILRALLNMTQQQFADIIITSRVTLNKIENTEDMESISSDVAFRLYYITNEIMENPNFSQFTRERAQNLRQRIEQELLSVRRILSC